MKNLLWDNIEQLKKNKDKFFLIAGPCVIENIDIMKQTANFLRALKDYYSIDVIFKSSYKKANRTSINSYTGPGIDEGLKILSKIKKNYDLPICTDVHEVNEIEKVAEVADIIQIPAFLCRQTDLLVTAGKTNKIVNIKKGQFMAAEDMKHAYDKVLSTGNNKILLTERGTSFGYHNLVVDFRSFPTMASINNSQAVVVYDVTHSLQQPSINNVSGGTPEHANMMANAAIATTFVNGLFIETHPTPSIGLSDSKTMVNFKTVERIVKNVLKLLL